MNGATLNGVLPRGLGEFEAKNDGKKELEIYVNQINLPSGTQLTVLVDNVAIGQIVLDNNQRGKLELESEHGQTVPNITTNSTLTVKTGANTILFWNIRRRKSNRDAFAEQKCRTRRRRRTDREDFLKRI